MPREQIILDHLRLEFLQNPAAAVAVPQRQASGQTVFSMKERDWFHPVTNILPPHPQPVPFFNASGSRSAALAIHSSRQAVSPTPAAASPDFAKRTPPPGTPGMRPAGLLTRSVGADLSLRGSFSVPFSTQQVENSFQNYRQKKQTTKKDCKELT